MTVKRIAQIVAASTTIGGGAVGVGAVVRDALNSQLVSRKEYDATADKRRADDTARAIQLAGFQQTLNTVVDSQREAAETQKDIAKKLDEFILETLRERRGRR